MEFHEKAKSQKEAIVGIREKAMQSIPAVMSHSIAPLRPHQSPKK